MHLFSRGDVIVHRDVHASCIWYARAEIVVDDSENERLVTYWCPGADVRAPVGAADGRPLRVPTRQWVLEPRPWGSTHVLSWWRPGDAYSVWLFWEAESWRFAGWYINLQSPFIRTPIGFDATDDILDVSIAPDGTPSRKDDDELDDAAQGGAFTVEAAYAIRQEAARAIEAISSRELFTEPWTKWRPDHDWPVPPLRPALRSTAPSSWSVVRHPRTRAV
jgi:hypothetical protein